MVFGSFSDGFLNISPVMVQIDKVKEKQMLRIKDLENILKLDHIFTRKEDVSE